MRKKVGVSDRPSAAVSFSALSLRLKVPGYKKLLTFLLWLWKQHRYSFLEQWVLFFCFLILEL